MHVLQGEREKAADNKSLAQFNLEDIRQAARGEPQIEVTFDIDANGILNVSAKDKATGKEQSFVIQASSGLTEAEVDRMVKDAESHAREDRAFRELAEARNSADHLIHEARSKLHELGDSHWAPAVAEIEEAINMLETEIKGMDVAELRQKTQALAERLSALNQEQASTKKGTSAQSGSDDTVVDADFEDVSDNYRNAGS